MTKTTPAPTVRPGTEFSQRLLAQAMQLQRAEREYMNEADKLALCARVKKAREEAGFTELEISEMLDPPVTDRTIRNYETVRPPFKYLRQWAEITRVSYDWLLRGDEPAASPEPTPLADDVQLSVLLEVREMLRELRAQQSALEARVAEIAKTQSRQAQG